MFQRQVFVITCNHPVLSSCWSLRFTLINASNKLRGAGSPIRRDLAARAWGCFQHVPFRFHGKQERS